MAVTSSMEAILGDNTEILEQGDPAQDPKAFRHCLGQFATGVTVMTTRCGEQLAGMAVNSFAALSLDPPLVLWSIRKASSSLAQFRDGGHYAVNILAQEQVDIANAFGKPGADKFAQVAWAPGRLGAPLLDGAICTLECTLDSVLEGGDHLILVGRVQHYTRRSGKPLLFVQGRYGLAEDMPPASAPTGVACTRSAPATSLLRQFHYVSHLMSSRFDMRRQHLGMSVGEFRSYGWLMSRPMAEAELRDCLYLGENEFQEALATMRGRGHLVTDAQGRLQLTPAGLSHAQANADSVHRYEAQLLAGVSRDDLAATLRVIQALSQHARELPN